MTVRPAVVLLACSLLPVEAAQTISRYEIRRGSGGPVGALVAWVDEREVTVSDSAIAVWKGWNNTVLLYTQPASGDTAERGEGQVLRAWDALTSRHRTITSERFVVDDVTTVLDGGRNLLVISMHDAKTRAPWTALADSERGVYRRERNALPGPIMNGRMELRRYSAEQIEAARGRLADLPPASSTTVPLSPSVSPVGTWSVTLPAASASERLVRLILAGDGAARLEHTHEGRGQVTAAGRWHQEADSVTVTFDESSAEPLMWRLDGEDLRPLTWSKAEYGERGLPMHRDVVALNAPGPVR